MLRYSQSLKVTDPRDRTVASINLIIDYNDDGSSSLPTYERSLRDSYLRIAHLLPFNCNSLQFLSQTNHLRKPDETVEGLPSWAPNWNPPGNASYFWTPFHAAGKLPMYDMPFQGEIDQGTLHVRGFLFDEVREIMSQRNNSSIPLSKLASLTLPKPGASPNASDNMKRLADTLICPSLAEDNLPPNYFNTAEMTLYTGILLSYGFVTPGLRICDLTSRITESYTRFQSIRTTITTLRNFKECYPPILNGLDLERLPSTIARNVDKIQRFQHFIYLVNHTLSSGCLTSMYSDNLAVVEGRADVEPDDEIWIIFGCPTPMILRHGSPHYTVISPAYIHDIMNGETVEGVVTPDDQSGWEKVLRTGRLGPEIEVPYTSGKGDWLVKVISLH